MTVDVVTGLYVPILFLNEFWTMNEHLIQINASTTELPLSLTFSPTSVMKWMLTSQMQVSMQAQAAMHGEDTMDEFKRMLTETSPALLAVTVLVSMLHTLFDILAFKNDITFWKNNKYPTPKYTSHILYYTWKNNNYPTPKFISHMLYYTW